MGDLTKMTDDVKRAFRLSSLTIVEDQEPDQEALGCDHCDDSGWYCLDLHPWEAGFGEALPCPHCTAPEIARRRQERLFGDAEIPALFTGYTLASFPGDQEAKAAVERWAESDDPGSLYLWGELGRGKTSLAICAMRERMLRHGNAGLFRPVPNILATIRDTYSHREDAPSEEEVVAGLTRTPLLVLDDIGAEKASEWVTATLYRILNDRYLERRPTIFTSNLRIVDVGIMLKSARISSRIERMCTAVVHVGGATMKGEE